MTTVGFGSGFFSSEKARNSRSKKRKRDMVRYSLLETLEARQLMTVGPQLVGVQPNQGAQISLSAGENSVTVLNTSPREFVLRFDDAAGLDPNTLMDGIRIKRAGPDGVLETAYVSTDLGTNGQVVLDFSSPLPGQQGVGVEIVFSSVSRTTGVPGRPISWPVLSVDGNRINVQVNTRTGSQTTAADLIQAMTEDQTVASKVLVKRLRGVESTVIATTVPVGQVYSLRGADAARVSSNLGSSSNALQVEFLSTLPSAAGNGTRIEVVSRDFGGAGLPEVSVHGPQSGPRTIRVEVNSNIRFSTTVGEFIDAINNSFEASALVNARLVSGSLVTRMGANPTTYSPLTLVAGDDVAVIPNFIGFGDTDREVVVRFAETLPDDAYLIDILGSGPFALRSTAGLPFNGGVSRSVRFDLDLGPTIQSIVPQPVVRSGATLTQLRNVIHVYFNDDKLNINEATRPQYYQLVYTNNTLTSLDDIAFQPSAVNYDAVLNRVTLTFNRNLDELADSNGNILPVTTLRLRIGNNQPAVNAGVTQVPVNSEPGTRFDTAFNLGGAWTMGGGARAVIVESEIRNTTPFPLDFPGANDEAGIRNNRYQRHVNRVDQDGIEVINYNFASALGTANNSVQLNAITAPQKDMVRQIFSLYEKYFGVRFQESDNLGLTIAVGDMLAINPLTSLTPVEPNREGGRSFAAGPLLANASVSAVIIDIQDFNAATDNEFGSELFRSFMRGIGVLLGWGTADEMPQPTVQNNAPITDPNTERVFPGNHDIVHGQFMYRPESKDIDLYRFEIPASGGAVNIEVAAERLANSSTLDASLRLFRNEGTTSNPRWVEIAANEDYFSNDPHIRLDFLPGGIYAVGVSAKGNTNYNPLIEDSGMGGKSEGRYQLRIDFAPPALTSLTDSDGAPTRLDGNGDGQPGGTHNFWFIPTRPDRATAVPGTPDTSVLTVWVDKTAANGGTGTLASPFNTISQAMTAAQSLSNANLNGNRNVVVRILGNSQNRAYEIGTNRFGQALADGAFFNVPKNVTVMIDAGAIIKMGQSRIGVGSSTVSVDRSGGALQVLGTPDARVIITSINDRTGVGVNPDLNPPAARPGDWGGIDFRNKIDGSDETRTDRERNGLFLNTIYHSDIRFGGGQVIVDGVSQVITPINIIDSRPTIANSLVTRSADAAMSATPNSFREDNFRDPRSQATGFFIPDYDRVGPDIHGNRIVDNTLNGLFVRTSTGVAGSLETVTVAARFNDTDIVHILGENLIIEGQPGGGIVDSVAPPTTLVTLSALPTGSLAAGTYNYRLVYVDANGNEGIASTPTDSLTVGDDTSIRLSNLPPVIQGTGIVSRRLYRSDATGGGTYSFVAQLDAVATTFTDNGTVTGQPLNVTTATVRSRLDGSLVVDPGILIKAKDARIEVRKGGSLIAEGTPEAPIIITSLLDTSYGIGGTSRTTTSVVSDVAAPGNWGGIFVGHASAASIDHVRIAYAGGLTRIEGGFASFNPIEIHQADVRIANSRITDSASGTEGSTSPTRVGRGTNGEAAIFVRGAQPVIVNNVISGNGGAAINIDVNSLTSELVVDRGRMTGNIGIVDTSVGNKGPLVKGNRLADNLINGMEVRAGILTTQSVWDDSDIVHVLRGEVVSSNTYSFGGVKLMSQNGQSLVVKLQGQDAGFTATGVLLDIEDRIGGSVSLIGQPNAPVILTSLSDNTVGAGFTPDGRPNLDTIEDLRSVAGRLPTGPEVNNGTLIDNDVAVGIPGQFSFQVGAGGRSGFAVPDGFGGGISAQGNTTLFSNTDAIFEFFNFIDVGINGGAIELGSTNITQPPTLIRDDFVVSRGTFVGNGGNEVRWTIESFMENGIATVFNRLSLESDSPLGDMLFINYLDEDVLLPSDDLLYLVGTPGEDDFRAFTLDGPERIGFAHGGIYNPGGNLINASFEGWAADSFRNLLTNIETVGTEYTIPGNINLDNLPLFTDPVLGNVFGLGDITTAFSWRVDPNATSATMMSFLELVPANPASAALPGDWRGIELLTNSNDRNIAVIHEIESNNASAPAGNDTPQTAQFLGQLASSLNGGDETARLGFQIHGTINKNSDVDVYSFFAKGRTEVWLDIDRTTFGLDTVVELIAEDGTILALSDNSYLEENSPDTHPIYSILPGNSANPLRKSSLLQAPTTSLRNEARDDFSTNPLDAGFRVVLPGQDSVTSLYHIRVRSSNQSPSQPAGTPALSDPTSVGQGLSRGAYQLQVRLGEAQEHPGSSIMYADIRYAQTGIALRGVPRHSPLLGETAEINTPTFNNNTFENAQYLGNLLSTDRRAISLAGSIAQPGDIDWYSFDIDYQLLETPLAQYFSTVFDLDYADGIGRADLSLHVFNSNGNLIYISGDSNITDDRSTSLSSAGNFDLSRGSTGTLDPFLGSVELPAGRYFVAISSRNQAPSVVANRNDRNASDATANGIRITPINSNQNIVEDRVGDRRANLGSAPIVPQFLPTSSRVAYNFGDVPMYLLGGLASNASDVFIANPFTGEVSNYAGRTSTFLDSFAIRPNGDIRGFQSRTAVQNDGTAGYVLIDAGTGASQVTDSFGLITRQLNPTLELEVHNVGLSFSALTFAGIDGNTTEAGFVVANRAPGRGVDANRSTNILYRFDPNTGLGISSPGVDDQFNIAIADGPDVILGAGTNITERGYIRTEAPAGATSQRVAVTEATEVVGNTTRNLIRDGDLITVRTTAGTLVTLEMNSGPELALQFDPSIPGRALLDGDEFTIDGQIYRISTAATPPVVPGVRIVSYNSSMTNQQFVESLRNSIAPTIQIGFDGNRVNFSGATTGSFGTLIARNVARDLGSNGTVGAGRIAVNFLAQDTAATIAVRIAQAANTAGFAGLSASVNGNIVQFVGATLVSAGGSARIVGIAPGGLVTGIAQVGGALYAVSNQGGLYRVAPQFLNSVSNNNIAQYVEGSFSYIGVNFTSLTSGPRNVAGGLYDNILFATDAAGNIYAFDVNGTPQPVFAGGATSVSTGIAGLTGITFSNLDFNLWHVTNRRALDTVTPGGAPAHGVAPSPDGSDDGTFGGQSWYFGFENVLANSNQRLQPWQDPLAQPRANANPLENTYNFPGGAKGVLESQPFSLQGLTFADKPTLYFNYFLSTEDAIFDQINNERMLDSFRVYGMGDNGTWQLLVTNNDNTDFEGGVERAIDNVPGGVEGTSAVAWRQARVDLGQFAGNRNVQLRFEFSTAGGMGYGFFGGRGVEMRALAGNQLADGQSFNVGGRRFELEMGPTLSIPSGSTVTNLETLTVLGTEFVLWNGTGSAPAGNVIRYEATDSPTQLAEKIFDALSNATFTRPTFNINLADPAGGSDTLDRALSVGINGEGGIYRGIGAIGDNPNLAATPDRDIDLVRMNLQAGSQVVVRASATEVTPPSPLDPYLRIFDSVGRQLFANNDFGGSRDSQITFTVPADGVYFIGVSGSTNVNYNPNVAGSGTAGGSQGQYQLTVDVTPRLNISIAENRIQLDGARSVVLPTGSSLRLTGGNGLNDTTAVPVYVTQTMTAEQVATSIRNALVGALAGNSSFEVFARRGAFIDMTGVTVNDPGPFTIAGLRPEDALSEWGLPAPNRPALRSQNNGFEGLFLDDFIIAVAERGEQVANAPQDTTFTTVGTGGIVTGTYQLEIRGGAEYGVPRFESGIDLVRGFAPNEVHSNSQVVRFNSAANIADGQVIQLTDGTNVVNLEFEDVSQSPSSPSFGVRPGNIRLPFNPMIGESAAVIAARVRDLINSPTVQSLIRGGAISTDGSTSGVNGTDIILVGTLTMTLPSNAGVVVNSRTAQGDRNIKREQGQVVISSTKVSFSNGFGIEITADERDPLSNAPNPGAVRNLITLNNQRLAPGAVVVNNVLFQNGAGGIRIEGDTVTGNVPTASLPFARVVNNTIVGGAVAEFTATPAATFEGDFYSFGSMSFADRVVSYNPTAGGGPAPIPGLQDATAAIGVPNYTGIGEPQPGQGAVSLGRGGTLVLQFTDNILTGSDDARPDLAVYQVGQSENVLVEVSADGVNWTFVGTTTLANRYIDLDAYGFNSTSQLQFVRLRDEPNQGPTSGNSVGADIDAVGALSTRPATVYAPGGTGISVGGNASPTLMNNVLVNNSLGLSIASTSQSTVVGGTLYQNNTQNVAGGSTGQFPIIVPNNLPLFVNPGKGILYPARESRLIDSSIDSLEDRSSLVAVKLPLGLPNSPIIAPNLDITGQQRVDDPSVAAPPGLGESVFKDRGAFDRSDFVGPSAFALNPRDNDAAGTDRNSAVGIVEVIGATLNYFDIQLRDSSILGSISQGNGIDQSTVDSNAIILVKDGNVLVEGQDYRFGFDPTSNIVRLTPLSGLWENGSVYQIRFVNSNESLITLADPRDLRDGSTISIQDINRVTHHFEIDTGIRLVVPQSQDGLTHGIQDGTVFRIDDGTRVITFEFDLNDNVRPDNIPIAIEAQDLPDVVAQKIAGVVRSTVLNLRIQSIGRGQLQILGDKSVAVLPDTSSLGVSGATGVTPTYGFRIPSLAGQTVGVFSGQTFAVQRANTVVTFELTETGTVGAGRVPVILSTNTNTLAQNIAAAINGAGLAVTAASSGGGFIAVGNQIDLRLQATNTAIQVVGAPGRAASIPIEIDLNAVSTNVQVATIVKDVIESRNLVNVVVTQSGANILVEGALGVAGTGVSSISGIRDIAGNAMRATELDGSTVTTIFLGEGRDYGDLPAPYISRRADNGPSHIVVEGFSLGNTVSADADARLPNLDDDDGVTVNQMTAAYQSNIVVNVQGASISRIAYVHIWIDFNGNGSFEDAGEKLAVLETFTSGDFTIPVNVPPGAVTNRDIGVRVRLSTQRNLTSLGPDGAGEVEDYLVRINANPHQNQSNRFDVNGDGFVSAIDVLQVINHINATGGGPLPLNRPTPPFLDVDGDSVVGSLDVLAIINHINSNVSNSGGEGLGEGEGEFSADMWFQAPLVGGAEQLGSDWNASHSYASGDHELSNSGSDLGAFIDLDDDLADEFDWSLMGYKADKETDDHDLALGDVLQDLLL
ncbi:GEVED domain-containing protein [Pirellulaceae bacterium SH449]